MILKHDNARPHFANVVKIYLKTLNWDVLPHLPYSIDIAPSNFHLFRSMKHGLAEQHFRSHEETGNWVDFWITSKDEQFSQRGIHMLSETWEKLVVSGEKYFEE